MTPIQFKLKIAACSLCGHQSVDHLVVDPDPTVGASQPLSTGQTADGRAACMQPACTVTREPGAFCKCANVDVLPAIVMLLPAASSVPAQKHAL